jgi:hypothetical protein
MVRLKKSDCKSMHESCVLGELGFAEARVLHVAAVLHGGGVANSSNA